MKELPAPEITEARKKLQELFGRSVPKHLAKAPDTQSRKEEQALNNAQHQAFLESFTQDTAERKRYAHRIYCLICVWIGCIGLIVFMQGFGTNGFWLDKQIVNTLIGGTTASVLGMFLIVARYLFPKR